MAKATPEAIKEYGYDKFIDDIGEEQHNNLWENEPRYKVLFGDQQEVYSPKTLNAVKQQQASKERGLANLEAQGDFITGIKRNIDQTQGAGYGAVALTGRALENMGADNVGQRMQDFGMEGYRRNLAEAAENPARYSFKDVWDGKAGLGGTADFVQGTIGSLLPSMATAALGGGAGGFAAKKLITGLTKKGLTRAAQAGMVSTVATQEAGGMYADLLETHGVKAPAMSAALGTLSGALELLGGNSKLIGTLINGIASGSAKTAKRGALEIVHNMGEEGLQEAGQSAIGILNTVLNTDEKFFTNDNKWEILESAAAGVVGGGFGGAANTMMGKTSEAPDQEARINERVDNIKSAGEANIQQAVVSLTEQNAANTKILNNPLRVQRAAQAEGMSIDDFTAQLTAETDVNSQIVSKLTGEEVPIAGATPVDDRINKDAFALPDDITEINKQIGNLEAVENPPAGVTSRLYELQAKRDNIQQEAFNKTPEGLQNQVRNFQLLLSTPELLQEESVKRNLSLADTKKAVRIDMVNLANQITKAIPLQSQDNVVPPGKSLREEELRQNREAGLEQSIGLSVNKGAEESADILTANKPTILEEDRQTSISDYQSSIRNTIAGQQNIQQTRKLASEIKQEIKQRDVQQENKRSIEDYQVDLALSRVDKISDQEDSIRSQEVIASTKVKAAQVRQEISNKEAIKQIEAFQNDLVNTTDALRKDREALAHSEEVISTTKNQVEKVRAEIRKKELLKEITTYQDSIVNAIDKINAEKDALTKSQQVIASTRQKANEVRANIEDDYWQEVKTEIEKQQQIKMLKEQGAAMKKRFLARHAKEIEKKIQEDLDAKESYEATKLKGTVPLAEQYKRQRWFQQIAKDLGDVTDPNRVATGQDRARTIPGEHQLGAVKLGSAQGMGESGLIDRTKQNLPTDETSVFKNEQQVGIEANQQAALDLETQQEEDQIRTDLKSKYQENEDQLGSLQNEYNKTINELENEYIEREDYDRLRQKSATLRGQENDLLSQKSDLLEQLDAMKKEVVPNIDDQITSNESRIDEIMNELDVEKDKATRKALLQEAQDLSAQNEKLKITPQFQITDAIHYGSYRGGDILSAMLHSGEGSSILGPGIYFSTDLALAKNVYSKYGDETKISIETDDFYDVLNDPIPPKLKAALAEGGLDTQEKITKAENHKSNFKHGRGVIGALVHTVGAEKARKLLVKHGIKGAKEKLPSGAYEIAVFDDNLLPERNKPKEAKDFFTAEDLFLLNELKSLPMSDWFDAMTLPKYQSALDKTERFGKPNKKNSTSDAVKAYFEIRTDQTHSKGISLPHEIANKKQKTTLKLTAKEKALDDKINAMDIFDQIDVMETPEGRALEKKLKEIYYQNMVFTDTVKIYRGMGKDRPGHLSREGYNLFGSSDKNIARSYSGAKGIIKALEIPVTKIIDFEQETAFFDKVKFDKQAKLLAPGSVLLARNVHDVGPEASKKIDPEMRYSYPSDIYAFGQITDRQQQAIKELPNIDPVSFQITEELTSAQKKLQWEIESLEAKEKLPAPQKRLLARLKKQLIDSMQASNLAPTKAIGKLYHGSSREGLTSGKDLPDGHRGYFLTEDPTVASKFGTVHEATLSIPPEKIFDARKPEHAEALDKIAEKTAHINKLNGKDGQVSNAQEGSFNFYEDPQVFWALKDLGFEANWQVEDGANVIRVFNKNAIESFTPQFQIVYHGTPHQWQPEPGFPNGRPRLDMIMNKEVVGEGAWAYGAGWYSADSKEVGASYLDSSFDYLVNQLADISDISGNSLKGKESLHKQLTDKLNKYPSQSGSLYKLDIPDSVIPKLLDWDKSLKQQNSNVKNILKQVTDFLLLHKDKVAPIELKHIKEESITGRALYKELRYVLGSKQAASEYLASLGIPGNKYLDGMSRSEGKGNLNYVLWDQKVLDQVALLERNQEKLHIMQAEIRNDKTPSKGISLLDIKNMYKDQEVFQNEDGLISVKLKNGKGITFQSIQDAGEGFIQYAISTGQMSKNGKILGVTLGSDILLDENFADNRTLWHENKHVLDNLGMITKADNAALNKEFNKLNKAGQLDFALSTHTDPIKAMEENRANMFAQIMVNKDAYAGTTFEKIIQKIMEFFNKMLGLGRQSISGLISEVESGKIYERQVNGKSVQTIKPQTEVTAEKWYSTIAKTIDASNMKSAKAGAWLNNIKKAPGIKKDELDWTGLSAMLLENPQKKLTKDEITTWFNEHQVKLEEVVLDDFSYIEQELEALYSEQAYLDQEENLSPLMQQRQLEVEDEIDALTIRSDFFSEETGTKFYAYKEAGGQDYKELIITLPGKTKYTSNAHWGDTSNPVVHFRILTRFAENGSKILHAEEVQSDWDQELRKKGESKDLYSFYNIPVKRNPNGMPTVRSDMMLKNKINQLLTLGEITQEQARNDLSLISDGDQGIERNPFSENAVMLGMKRMVRYAAENGFNKIAWSGADIQVKRWGSEAFNWKTNLDGDLELSGFAQVAGDAFMGMAAQLEGKTFDLVDFISSRDDVYDHIKDVLKHKEGEYSKKTWEEYLDKTADKLWQRMQENPTGEYLPRKEGMVEFYNKMLPRMLQKEFGKGQWGSAKLDFIQVDGMKLPSMEITDRMRSKAMREGMPMFETREQIVPQETYDKVFTQKNNLLKDIQQIFRMKATDIKLLGDKLLGSTHTRLQNISPKLAAEYRNLDFRTGQSVASVLEAAHPLMLKAKKQMSAKDKVEWDWARKQSDPGKIDQLTQKYGLTEDYNNVRTQLNKLRQDAEDVGYNVGYIDEYWPRVIKDMEGFLQETQEISQQPIYSNAIKAEAAKLDISVQEFNRTYPEVRADIISNIILGHPTGISGPGNIQGRVFKEIESKYAKFYEDSDAALMTYIYSMTKKIEARRFFGKVPAAISKAKSAVKRDQTNLIKYEQLKALDTAEADTTNKDAYSKKIKSLQDNIKLNSVKIEEYKNKRDYTDNIGTYISDLMISGELGKKDEKLVNDILDARFHEHGTTGITNTIKNASYIDTMGSFTSAATQIGDLAWAMYVGKVWTPRGFSNTLKNFNAAVLKRSNITKENLGLDRIAQEFAGNDSLSKAVSKVFWAVGLEKMDSIGKEVLINNSLDNYKNRASTEAGRQQLLKDIRPIFGKESNQVIQDLLGNPITDNVKLLVYHRLLDFQPVALSEMPEKYLNAGNGRIFYMLKTYTIKQLDVFRREVFNNIKSGEQDKIITGISNMVAITTLLTLANAGADEIKDLMLGKEMRFEDHVIENLLTLGGASRYMKAEINQEGLGSAIIGQILPPTKFVDALSKDVTGDVSKGIRSVDSIPGIGKLYYWHMGKGVEFKKSIPEQDFNKAGKEVKKFKKSFEEATNKRLFLNMNKEAFKGMKTYEAYQSALRKNKSKENKLKELPQQSTAVLTELGKLNAQREDLYKQFNVIK